MATHSLNALPHFSGKLSALLLTSSVAVFGLSACGAEEVEVGSPTDAMIIVADTHANSPAPTLDARSRDLLADVMRNNAGSDSVQVIRVSAVPTIDTELRLHAVKGTPAGKEAIIQRNLRSIDESLAIGSHTDGADDLEAIGMAADALRVSGAANPVIAFIGSGLSDQGRLDFTTPGMLEADPELVSEHLDASGALPDLSGITVNLVGTGYTSGPQEPLDTTYRENVTAIWRMVLESAGAELIITPEPRTWEAVETSASVTPVEVPTITAPELCKTEEIIFTEQSQVSFRPEETVFVDLASAHAALEPIAQWLAADADRTAAIRGTTADDRSDPARLKVLGQRRADTVRELLITAGARPGQITAEGVGADFPEYVRPDLDPVTGLLYPGPAALNRSVRLALTDPC